MTNKYISLLCLLFIGQTLVCKSEETLSERWDHATHELRKKWQDAAHQIKERFQNKPLQPAQEDPKEIEYHSVLYGDKTEFSSIKCSPDGKRAITGSADGTVRFWDLVDGKLESTPPGHGQHRHINDLHVGWSPNGKYAASAGSDGSVKVWDPQTGELIKSFHRWIGGTSTVTYYLNRLDIITDVTFTPDSQHVVIGLQSDDAQQWNIHTGKHTKLNVPDSFFYVRKSGNGKVAYNPDGTYVVSANNTLYQQDTKEDVSELFPYHMKRIYALNSNPNYPQIACAASHPYNAILINPHGSPYSSVPLYMHLLAKEAVDSLAYSPDGTQVATGDFKGNVQIWDSKTGKLLKTIDGHKKCQTFENNHVSIAYPTNRKLISVHADGEFRIWNIPTVTPSSPTPESESTWWETETNENFPLWQNEDFGS